MAEERLQPISLHKEMERSYLEYAMSVIVGRALPDARDGLKPVQRRILFAMHELGLTPDRPYRKCARVVGDVLGKYHPHGDQAVYDALVRLVQTFSSRHPVLDGHGNFGSVDDDPPAAMRYTETRLASIAQEAMLNEIGENTVDFSPNFDGSQQEPTVLPAQLPFLLLNGCSGIAVGMATSIPPHNLNEVVNGLIALIKNPSISDVKLLEHIPGPDFPTGGEVLIGSGVRETYLKGRGSIPMRGVAHIEEIQPGKGRHKKNAVVVTELPFQLSKAGWIEKLADLVNDGKIGGISDIRDESDREGMRVVVELRRDSNPENVLKELQRRTSLQNNFGAILLALINGQPKQLSLRELLQSFLEYRENTLTRRTKHKLNKTEERLEVLTGLIKALNNLQEVILLLQEAPDASRAKASLIVKLSITERQADAVLAMPLRKLTGLEQEGLRKEKQELDIYREHLLRLLHDRKLLLEELIKELKTLKKRFGNQRRTKLIEGGDALLAERAASQRPNTELQRQQALSALPSDGRLLIQHDQQVKIISPQLLGRLQLNKTSNLSDDTSPVQLIIPIENNPRLLAISKSGKIALIRWEFAGQQPGRLEKFLPGGLEGDKIVNLINLPKKDNLSLGLLSSDGRFKRLPIEEVLDLSGRAATILKLKEGVSLRSAIICEHGGSVVVASDLGRVQRFLVKDSTLPIMGKLAQGPLTMKLLPGEELIGAVSSPANQNYHMIIITKYGKITKLDINSLRICERGNIGQMAMKLKTSNQSKDKVVDIASGSDIISIVSNQNRYGRINISELDLNSSKELSSIAISLKDNETIQELVSLKNYLPL